MVRQNQRLIPSINDKASTLQEDPLAIQHQNLNGIESQLLQKELQLQHLQLQQKRLQK
jgi:hypothetical protein